MQTSSNFFNKNLFALEDYSLQHKRTDRYHESHTIPDPLRLKDELTPWTEINPKYNFNTERLIRFKQKTHQDQPPQHIDNQTLEAKQIKPDMISNLFNFYKNNKQKKRSTLNNAKRRSQRKNQINETDNSWTLPPIDDRQDLEEGLVQNKQSAKKSDEKQDRDKELKQNKKSPAYIESISIREYLIKLKEKQRVFASSSQTIQKHTTKDNPTKPQVQSFTSSRHSKAKTKPMFTNPISSVKDLGNDDISYRYAPIRNPQNQSYKKRVYMSPLQSLEQSFEIYKKAAEQEVQESGGGKKLAERYVSHKPNGLIMGEKGQWKNNAALSSLLSSPVLESAKRSVQGNESISPVKKYSTISYSRSFSPTQNSVELPKINKNSNHR